MLSEPSISTSILAGVPRARASWKFGGITMPTPARPATISVRASCGFSVISLDCERLRRAQLVDELARLHRAVLIDDDGRLVVHGLIDEAVHVICINGIMIASHATALLRRRCSISLRNTARKELIMRPPPARVPPRPPRSKSRTRLRARAQSRETSPAENRRRAAGRRLHRQRPRARARHGRPDQRSSRARKTVAFCSHASARAVSGVSISSRRVCGLFTAGSCLSRRAYRSPAASTGTCSPPRHSARLRPCSAW